MHSLTQGQAMLSFWDANKKLPWCPHPGVWQVPGMYDDMTIKPLSFSPPGIGFDIDGVVADTMAAFLRIAREEYGHGHLEKERITSYWLEECLDIPPETVGAIIQRILDDPFGVGLEPINGARDVLLRFAAKGPLTFVTARPSGESIEEWLRDLLPEVPQEDLRVIATGRHAAKKDVLRELGIDAFVEDNLETCEDLHAAGMLAAVFDQPWNRARTPWIRVGSWEEILALTGE